MTDFVSRPTPRGIFLTRDRQLEIFFYTSNTTKYIQARVVFERAGLLLQHFRSRTEPYAEDYREGKELLLTRAIGQVIGRGLGTGSLFFVEDTSLRIEALSTVAEDFPGLAVKEWFPLTSFHELDSALKERGEDRRAEIKSDIALHVPGFSKPVFFRGRTIGHVADGPPAFEENSRFPWLTPNTFNGWFIPDGAANRLGEMNLEESWRHDFRTQALESLISRLEEYTAILNLPTQSYIRRQSPAALKQLPLFAGTVFIIVGHTCAGKTTFGDRAHDTHGLSHIEASSIVRMIQRDTGSEGSSTFEFAQKLLQENGPEIVALKILQMYSSQFDKGVVITGFRTVEELELIKSHLPHAKVLYIEASERTRFQRLLQRGRSPECRTIEDFHGIDEQQMFFGLLRVAEDFADIRVVNEGTLDQFATQIDAILSGTYGVIGVTAHGAPPKKLVVNQLLRCFNALDSAGRPMSTDEIEQETAKTGTKIRHNNANKVLKRVPEFVRRLEIDGVRVRYELLNAGRAYLRYMQRYKAFKIGQAEQR
jgi:inosine/xanthosine triphosphate pyrophosphatase family protein/dephospho-CoA kinase